MDQNWKDPYALPQFNTAGLFCFECSEGHTFQTGVPATVFEKQTETALIEYISLLTQQQMELALRGVCPYCHGQMSSGIEVTTDEAHAYLFRGTCKHCGVYVCNTVGSCVVRHPAVVGFLYDYGIDVRTEPYWTLDVCRDEATLRSTDPLKLEVAVQREDEELRLTLDEDATVITVERIETATST